MDAALRTICGASLALPGVAGNKSRFDWVIDQVCERLGGPPAIFQSETKAAQARARESFVTVRECDYGQKDTKRRSTSEIRFHGVSSLGRVLLDGGKE